MEKAPARNGPLAVAQVGVPAHVGVQVGGLLGGRPVGAVARVEDAEAELDGDVRSSRSTTGGPGFEHSRDHDERGVSQTGRHR